MNRKDRIINLLILCASVLLIVGIDRGLLMTINPGAEGIWIPDKNLHFKHRPLALSKWTAFGNKPIRINSHGHHDDEFPSQKPRGELRILCLGDSVTMGHGVTREETYANQLESILSRSSLDFASYQVINAGVQGYTTFQELEVLRRSLIFEPDLITVGFVMNDVTEPLVVDRNFGGTGFDYHEIFQTTSKVANYLLNQTGFGRFAGKVQYWLIGGPVEARLQEMYNVEKMVKANWINNDEKIKQSWTVVLKDLGEIYQVAESKGIAVTLLIFPYTFQLYDPAMQWPQQLLTTHAQRYGVHIIDFTKVFEDKLAPEHRKVGEYFIDEDHLTVEGHKIVAEVLSLYLQDKFNAKR